MIKCKLIYHSNSIQLQQLFTGLSILHKQKHISLQQMSAGSRNNKFAFRSAANRRMKLVLNDMIHCFYDMEDGTSIDEEELEHCQFYFKRSCNDEHLSKGGVYSKIKPFGLNYLVYPDHTDRFGFERALKTVPFPSLILDALNYIPAADLFHFVSRKKNMEYAPKAFKTFKILSLVRVWDPNDLPGRTEAAKEDRNSVNVFRAECIKALRKEFGNKFTGGIQNSAFAQKNYPGLIANETITTQKGYFEQILQHPVCVASRGLLNANGWKMAEYMAFSRAILAEELFSIVPGNLQSGTHYLGFSTPDACVEHALILEKDFSLIEEMMQANWNYYNAYVRPDAIMKRSIDFALNNL